jgi:hypothetical protein
VIEGGHHFFHRRVRIEAVDLIEVDRVDAQAAEAVLTRLLDVLPRKPAHVGALAHREEHLRPDDELVEIPILAKPPPSDLLAHPKRIHIGSVEEVDTRLDGPFEKRRRCIGIMNPRPPLR